MKLIREPAADEYEKNNQIFQTSTAGFIEEGNSIEMLCTTMSIDQFGMKPSNALSCTDMYARDYVTNKRLIVVVSVERIP